MMENHMFILQEKKNKIGMIVMIRLHHSEGESINEQIQKKMNVREPARAEQVEKLTATRLASAILRILVSFC